MDYYISNDYNFGAVSNIVCLRQYQYYRCISLIQVESSKWPIVILHIFAKSLTANCTVLFLIFPAVLPHSITVALTVIQFCILVILKVLQASEKPIYWFKPLMSIFQIWISYGSNVVSKTVITVLFKHSWCSLCLYCTNSELAIYMQIFVCSRSFEESAE